MKRKVLVKTSHGPSDVWVMVSGVKPTYDLRDELLSKLGWLTDDHIDVAQHIMHEQNPGVGGLRSIVATTHYSRFALPHDPPHVIQCHNRGAHWVTSSSISEKVVVYESLYRSLNESLKRQLVNIYRKLCNEDGSLEITVVVQQRQIGALIVVFFALQTMWH